MIFFLQTAPESTSRDEGSVPSPAGSPSQPPCEADPKPDKKRVPLIPIGAVNGAPAVVANGAAVSNSAEGGPK